MRFDWLINVSVQSRIGPPTRRIGRKIEGTEKSKAFFNEQTK